MNKHTLPDLSYEYNALEPHIDEQTMRIHHTKHHQTYVDKLNAALEKHPELFQTPIDQLLQNLHTFFWQSMSPTKTEPRGTVLLAIVEQFGSLAAFKEQFSTAALGVFGSGWTWLVLNNGTLEICSTANQDSPLSEGKTPVLGLDVWEHAYYLKHQSARAAYIGSWWNVIDWNHAEKLYNNAR